MAGMPVKVVERAKEILKHLENTHGYDDAKRSASIAPSKNEGVPSLLSFFQLDDPSLAQIREEILNIDINNLTPVEALMKLNEIRKIVSGY
jgi:DNA mismatch repair protein MutS